MRFYDSIPLLPADPIFGLSAKYRADPRPDKYTFITGYFKDETLKTPLLATVAQVEKELAEQKMNKEYLPIEGDLVFATEIGKLVFGDLFDKERMLCFQTIGATGALYLIGKLARQWTTQIALSDPTWPNHFAIFEAAGLNITLYPYYENRVLPFEKLLSTLHSLEERSCVLIHTNCHNPTGLDLSHEQWHELATLLQKKHLFAILDMAYQGFSGTLEEDAFGPLLFLKQGLEFALTYTCAKNFSIYGERAGALFLIANSSKKLAAINSQIKASIRSHYSNPPLHPALLVKTILQTPPLYARWLQELETMRKRMQTVRMDFFEALMRKDPHGHWEQVKNSRGLFCYSGLSEQAVTELEQKAALYLAKDGRINLTGINHKNIERLVDAILTVT